MARMRQWLCVVKDQYRFVVVEHVGDRFTVLISAPTRNKAEAIATKMVTDTYASPHSSLSNVWVVEIGRHNALPVVDFGKFKPVRVR